MAPLMAGERVSLRIRLFVATFLLLLSVCAVARIEAWPLTGWRLFSHVRKPVQTSWQAVVVSPAGGESTMGFSDAAFRGTTHVLAGFPSLSPAARDAVCRAWIAELRGNDREAASIRIDRVTVDHSRRSGRRAAEPVDRVPRYECRAGVVRSVP